MAEIRCGGRPGCAAGTLAGGGDAIVSGGLALGGGPADWADAALANASEMPPSSSKARIVTS